ncbi:MAG: DUF177 domain-containing protein [Bacteroidota bacterium]
MGKELQKFNIDIFKLRDGEHEYTFQVGDEFFTLFEESPLEKGDCKVYVELLKNSSLLQFQFKISGTLELICDRSLEVFNYEIEEGRKLIFKYGPEELELSDEIVMIEHGTLSINLAQYIYEYIVLAIPYRKIHPKYDEADSEENLVYVSEENDPNDSKVDEKGTDPRWDSLRNLNKQQDN